MKISEVIASLELAKQDLGDVDVMVDFSAGMADSWPILHIVHGTLPRDLGGEKYCQIISGLVKGDDPELQDFVLDEDEMEEADSERMLRVFEKIVAENR